MGVYIIIFLVKLAILLLVTIGVGYTWVNITGHAFGFFEYSALFLFIFIINGLAVSFNKKSSGY